MTYTEQIQKEAEKLAEIQHENNRKYQPFLDPWDKLSEREQYIKTEMQEDAARYLLEQKAKSYEEGWSEGRLDYDSTIPTETKTLAIYLKEKGYIE